MAGEAAIINTGGSGGGGGGGIPGGWRTIVIAGGAVAALIAVMMQKSGGGSSSGPTELGTSANVALGQVAFEQRAAAGVLGGQLANLQSAFDTQAGQLSTQIANAAAYQKQVQRSVLGLYIHNMAQGQDLNDVNVRRRIWDSWIGWSKAYGLGDVAAFDPTQDIWGSIGVYPIADPTAP